MEISLKPYFEAYTVMHLICKSLCPFLCMQGACKIISVWVLELWVSNRFLLEVLVARWLGLLKQDSSQLTTDCYCLHHYLFWRGKPCWCVSLIGPCSLTAFWDEEWQYLLYRTKSFRFRCIYVSPFGCPFMWQSSLQLFVRCFSMNELSQTNHTAFLWCFTWKCLKMSFF